MHPAHGIHGHGHGHGMMWHDVHAHVPGHGMVRREVHGAGGAGGRAGGERCSRAHRGAACADGGQVQPRRRIALTAAAAHLAQQAHVRAGDRDRETSSPGHTRGEQVGPSAGHAATGRRHGGGLVARRRGERARLGGHSITGQVAGQGRDPLARHSPRTAAVPARDGNLM
eukprot:scaffold16893_cov63-Phaeocystis_antarctica.AAC.3